MGTFSVERDLATWNYNNLTSSPDSISISFHSSVYLSVDTWESNMESFKAIVVGAGPVGLVLAHALQVSGIDYVLVEQRSQIPPDPAYGLFLWPHIMRIFHQLGILEAVEAVAQPMVEAVHRSIDGSVIHRSRGFEELGAL